MGYALYAPPIASISIVPTKYSFNFLYNVKVLQFGLGSFMVMCKCILNRMTALDGFVADRIS